MSNTIPPQAAVLRASVGTYFFQVPAMGPALHFLRDVLGFRLRHELCFCRSATPTEGELAAHDWLEFEAGITLFVQANMHAKPRELGLGVQVDECDHAYAVLREAGIGMLEIPFAVAEGVRGFNIKDPFGNTWFVYGQ